MTTPISPVARLAAPAPASSPPPLALLLAAGRARSRAQDKDPVVAKVNGVEIHQSDLAVAEEDAGADFRRCRRTPSGTTWCSSWPT